MGRLYDVGAPLICPWPIPGSGSLYGYKLAADDQPVVVYQARHAGDQVDGSQPCLVQPQIPLVHYLGRGNSVQILSMPVVRDDLYILTPAQLVRYVAEVKEY